MKIKSIGANQTEVIRGDGSVILISFETAVAGFLPGVGYVRTAERWSKTTQKHVAQWLGATVGKVSIMPQKFFDDLI